MHAFYVIVPPEQRAFGVSPPEWWLEDYFRWLRHPYYVGLLSAAAMHGSQPQAVQVVQIVTDTPRREISLGRVTIWFYVKRAAAATPTEQPQGARSLVRVSTVEATALDLIRYSAKIGGMSRVAETIAPLLGKMRSSALEDALNAVGEPALGQRFGYLLDFYGQPRLAKAVQRWLPARPPLAVFEPGTPNDATETNARWRLMMNAQLAF